MTDVTKTDSQNRDSSTLLNVHFVLDELVFTCKRHALKVTYRNLVKRNSQLREEEANMD